MPAAAMPAASFAAGAVLSHPSKDDEGGGRQGRADEQADSTADQGLFRAAMGAAENRAGNDQQDRQASDRDQFIRSRG